MSDPRTILEALEAGASTASARAEGTLDVRFGFIRFQNEHRLRWPGIEGGYRYGLPYFPVVKFPGSNAQEAALADAANVIEGPFPHYPVPERPVGQEVTPLYVVGPYPMPPEREAYPEAFVEAGI